MFKSCRNYLKKYYLCQKSAKSGSARIWKCVLTTPSGGHLFNQGHNGFQNCGKLFINWEAARGRCSLIFNVTAFSNVKLHILGKAIWLTIFFNHLWIDYSKYDIYHQYFAQKQVNCVFFKSTILIQARASQSYSQTALICTHFEQLGHFHMEAKSFPPPVWETPVIKKKVGFIFHFRTSGTFLVFTKKSPFWVIDWNYVVGIGEPPLRDARFLHFPQKENIVKC